MEPQQSKLTLVKLLGAVLWEDAPGLVVLTGGAFASEDLEGDYLPDPRLTDDGPGVKALPFARVAALPEQPDPDQPRRLGDVVFRVWVTAGAGGIAGAPGTNDTHGIDQETGANRDPVQGQGKSTGRAVREVIARLIEAGLGGGELVDSTHAMQGWVGPVGPPIGVDGAQVITRSFDVTITNATVSRYYHAPTGVIATADGGGQITVTWRSPPKRHDTGTNVLRRSANNGAAPVLIGDGTPCALTGPTATSFVDTGLAPGAKYFYTGFHLYNEVTAGDRSSRGNPTNQVTVT